MKDSLDKRFSFQDYFFRRDSKASIFFSSHKFLENTLSPIELFDAKMIFF